jgi:hypothetical protein
MPHYFDDAFTQVGSAELKPIVKTWGGDYKMRKDECIAYMRAALKDPEKIKATLAKLQPWELNVLAIVKKFAGSIQIKNLEIHAMMSGLYPQRPPERYSKSPIDTLYRCGLLLPAHSAHAAYYRGAGYEATGCYCDDRILAQVGHAIYQPLDIQPETLTGETHFRSAKSVIMELMSLLQSIETLGGLNFTQSKTIRVSDETKLRRAMKWEDNSLEIDGFHFPSPLKAWLEVLTFSKLVKKAAENHLVLAESPASFAKRPMFRQTNLLMESFVNLQGWYEREGREQGYTNTSNIPTGRMVLALGLLALPFTADGFFSIQKFEQALFQRIGYHFSFGYIPSYPYFFRETPQEQQAKVEAWKQTVRANWVKDTIPWFVSMLTTWLYYLGLVELVMDGDTLSGFRLTELGRDTFHPELATAKPAESSSPASTEPAWVMQPNFDIVVYMDKAAPVQLAFLERCAERTDAHKHTAHYRLTRESIYRGLESGLTLEEIINTLQRGSQTELSQNILVELREWASLRERILLRRGASLLEFSSPQELNARMAQGLKGRVVAERFLLLDSAKAVPGWTIINYAQPLPQNLTVAETGLLRRASASRDLVTAAQLNQWAESTPDEGWQLTRESVGKAVKSGKKLSELLNLLNSRVIPGKPVGNYMPPPPPIPPLLELALRAWAGKAYPVELEEVILMRCPNEKIFQAVVSSPLMKPLLKGHQFPDLLFADPTQLETLLQRLEWLGWKVSDRAS